MYLEAASFLSATRFEGAGLLQYGSYAIGCKCTSQENSLVQLVSGECNSTCECKNLTFRDIKDVVFLLVHLVITKDSLC